MDNPMNLIWFALLIIVIKFVGAVRRDGKEMGYSPIPRVEWRGGAFPGGPIVYFLLGCGIGNYQNIYICFAVVCVLIIILKCDFYVRES